MHLKSATFEKKVHYFGRPYFQDPFFSASHIFVDVGETNPKQNALKIILVRVHGSQQAFFKDILLSFFSNLQTTSKL